MSVWLKMCIFSIGLMSYDYLVRAGVRMDMQLARPVALNLVTNVQPAHGPLAITVAGQLRRFWNRSKYHAKTSSTVAMK